MKIAEIGLCHDGDFTKAIELMDLAKKYGYEAVKFQKRSAGKWFSDATPRPDSPFGKTQGEHRHALELTPGMHKLLQKQAHKKDLIYGCSVWDPIAAYEIHGILEGDDFIKIGRPSNCDVGVLQTISNLLTKKNVPVIASCRTVDEANFIKDVYIRPWEQNGKMITPSLKILFCPGNYPDREQDLPEKLHSWADGTSLHHPDPLFGTALAEVSEMTERHIAAEDTQHRDKAWSIVLK